MENKTVTCEVIFFLLTGAATVAEKLLYRILNTHATQVMVWGEDWMEGKKIFHDPDSVTKVNEKETAFAFAWSTMKVCSEKLSHVHYGAIAPQSAF